MRAIWLQNMLLANRKTAAELWNAAAAAAIAHLSCSFEAFEENGLIKRAVEFFCRS